LTGSKKTMPDKNVNLFVYGSLKDPFIFESVCGCSFTLKPSHTDPKVLFAELALLAGYRRVSPDNVYFYAVPDPATKIEGFIIYNVPPAAMAEIDRYEGRLYERETVQVNTAAGLIETQAYLASPKDMQKHFGDRFHVNLIHELWLRKRIEKFFETHTRPGEKSLDADIERRARRELLGTTERDLVISHLGTEAVSDFYLEHELNRPCPSIKHLYGDQEVAPFIENYLALVVKQVLLNQFESTIQSRYRFELDRMGPSKRFFTRSISLLVALRMINTNSNAVNMILQQCLETMPADGRYDLIDYVKYAVSAADSVFDSRLARSEIERIRANARNGLIPLGAELELSNLGFKAVHRDIQGQDRFFDGFKYFHDFALNVLCWKLGGYVDDHTGEFGPGRRGFLELAPGRLNILGEISKPSTADPWVLNQLIRQIALFYPVRPHSLHLSFQVRRSKMAARRVLPLSFVKCLLVLGGGTQEKPTGRLLISRMQHNEMKQHGQGEELVFSRISKRRSRMRADEIGEKSAMFAASYVQQYKFIRLDPRANYASSPRLRRQYRELKEWSANPTEISATTRGRFLNMIKKGLLNEGHHQPAHKLHYIDWALGAIDIQLRLFNKYLRTPPHLQTQPTIGKILEDIRSPRIDRI